MTGSTQRTKRLSRAASTTCGCWCWRANWASRVAVFIGTSQITPFTYLQMAWPLLFGWLLFGQFPDDVSIAGMVTIVAGGVWLAWQERRRAQPLIAPPAD